MSVSTGGSTLELRVANQGQMLHDAPTVQHEGMMIERIDDSLGKIVLVVKNRYVVDLFSFIFALLFILMLVNFCWLVATTVDVEAIGSDRIMSLFNNISVVYCACDPGIQMYRGYRTSGEAKSSLNVRVNANFGGPKGL